MGTKENESMDSAGKPGVGDNPGKGGGKGRSRMSVCALQDDGTLKHKILPTHVALKHIAKGKAIEAPNGATDCQPLNEALVYGDEDDS